MGTDPKELLENFLNRAIKEIEDAVVLLETSASVGSVLQLENAAEYKKQADILREVLKNLPQLSKK